MRYLAIVSILMFAAICYADDARIIPLVHGHAHNDYEHSRPLVEALECGFCSIEADVHLVDGKLLVAHNREDVKPDRTLESLYLEPLRRRILANNGHVYPTCDESVILLIDLKTEARKTYPVVRELLRQYESILTKYENGTTQRGAITAIITGCSFGKLRDLMESETIRYAAQDGKMQDLTDNSDVSFVPQISGHWKDSFNWRGYGTIAAEERAKLRDIVSRAHQQHRQVRFWEAPDFPNAWKELRADGVDLINTDDLRGFRDWSQKDSLQIAK